MKLLCLVPYPTEGPSNRLRVEQYVPWLTQHGVACQVRPFMSPSLYRVLYTPGKRAYKVAMTLAGLAKRLTDLARAARADVVLVHREAVPFGTAVVERLIARVCPVVFDFDDAIYLENGSNANAWSQRFRSGKKIPAILSLSSHVIAGNRILEQYARQYHSRVTVIPTPVDTQQYQCRPAPAGSGKVVIGWIGTHSTAGYLKLLQEPLAALSRRYPHLEVRVVGAGRPPLRLPNLQAVRWELTREPDELHQLDIGLMPMPDNEWTRGKCGFKALLYMSAGVPVVASPVGSNTEIVRDGATGFLASDPGQWTDRLAQLIEDRGLRARMGAAGRTVVEERYSVEAQAPRLLDVLQRAAGSPGASQRNGSPS